MSYNDGDDPTTFMGLGCGTFLVLWVLSTFFPIVYIFLLAGGGILLVLSLIVYSNYSFKQFPCFCYYAFGYLSVASIYMLGYLLYALSLR